jgi:hypothetical protein
LDAARSRRCSGFTTDPSVGSSCVSAHSGASPQTCKDLAERSRRLDGLRRVLAGGVRAGRR